MRYSRKLFSFESKNARERLQENESVIQDGHQMVLDIYNGKLLDAEFDDWHAEHIFPLKSAWDAGFNKQYRDNPDIARVRMKEFANDYRNLCVAGASSNMSRGTKTLWNWVPLNLSCIPWRNTIVRVMAENYHLKLTASQTWAMNWSDKKINEKYEHGIHMGKVRAWLIQNGFYKFLMPF